MNTVFIISCIYFLSCQPHFPKNHQLQGDILCVKLLELKGKEPYQVASDKIPVVRIETNELTNSWKEQIKSFVKTVIGQYGNDPNLEFINEKCEFMKTVLGCV